MKFVGIDLGTTNSEIGIYRYGQFTAIPVDGNSYCPSVVWFGPNGCLLVGMQAKSRLMIDPEHTIASAKRNMGRPNFKYHLTFDSRQIRELAPEEVSAEVLRKLIDAAKVYLEDDELQAVISVPAYFNDDARAATRRAAELARIDVLRLVSEPTAAAIAYGLAQGKDQVIAVYDLGGGTFDVSILEVKDDRFEVKAVGGNPRLGGDDFDRRLMKYVLEEFRKASGIELGRERSAEVLQAKQRLKEACERAKKELSQATEATVNIPQFFQGKNLEVSVTRQKFEDLIEDLVDQTCEIANETIKDAGHTMDTIDRVVLVGGSTNIPIVRRKVKEKIKDPYVAPNVMDIVAHGAAILAAQYFMLKGEAKDWEEIIPEGVRRSLSGMEVSDIYPYRLGIAVVAKVPRDQANRFGRVLGYSESEDAAEVEGVFAEVVPRNERLPVSRTRAGFTPLVDYAKEVLIEIYRDHDNGDSCKEMTPLGKFVLGPLSPARREEHDIHTAFEINSDGILTVTAKDFIGSGREVKRKSEPIDVYRDIKGLGEEVTEEDDC